LVGSGDWVDWAITRTELAKSDEASSRAVATREKLFIWKTSRYFETGQKIESGGTVIQRPRIGVDVRREILIQGGRTKTYRTLFSLFSDAQSMMPQASNRVARFKLLL
jgi:hypothetical protein